MELQGSLALLVAMKLNCMPLSMVATIAVVACDALCATVAQPTAFIAPVFKAGFAERDVTPEVGMEMMGNYGKQYGRGIHDPCKARAAVFDDGTNRVALVGLDSLIIQRESVLRVRKAVTDRCGIPGGHVLLGASHSHSSGPVGWVMPGQFDHASALVQELAYKKSPCADPGYLRRFEQGIVDAVCAANDARLEARLCFGSGREDKVSFNRRLRMKDGTTFTHPGKGNPNNFVYAGPIDPEVGVIGAWNTNGALLGVIVNFSCHATTSPPGFSANWIYYLEKTIRGALGTQAPVVFLQGACGDITQVDNLSP
ncbi:MAG: neutral/alkaline non-lysosomal ceramidase N-terminal domain-containing protein, partial [Gammaproteobacteria bacterium]